MQYDGGFISVQNAWFDTLTIISGEIKEIIQQFGGHGGSAIGIKRLPRMRKVRCLNSSRNRPPSLIQVVRTPLQNARQHVWVWHDKGPSFLMRAEYRLKSWSFSPKMGTFQYECKILECDRKSLKTIIIGLFYIGYCFTPYRQYFSLITAEF